MTLHATRDGQSVTVHGNTGTEVLVENGHLRHVRITETAQHVEFFHDQLGKLLAAAKAEREQPLEPESDRADEPLERAEPAGDVV